ncbi:MAG: hypothetical protein ACYSWO_17265 [Planctomycetota bacterium]
MFNRVVCLSALMLMAPWPVAATGSNSIPIQNASFEGPFVDPNGFSALPFVDGWTELDLDTEMSSNTGVFANPAPESPGRLINAEGSQLAFLGSQTGNALEQDLIDTFRPGCQYSLTVAVGISGMFAPSSSDALELVLYYRNADGPADIARLLVEPAGLSSTELKDFSLHVLPVQAGDAWAGKPISVALRAAGMPGGFWDIDNVRLAESAAESLWIQNPSFEGPVVYPNGFSAVPMVEGWTELDLDAQMSTNTGVFANPAEGSPGHLVNTDGNQLAFLGSQTGNALEQDLIFAHQFSDGSEHKWITSYRVGFDYCLAVAVGVSGMFPPSAVEPVDKLELVLYYRDGDQSVDVARQMVETTGLSSTELKDFSLRLPTVRSDDPWAGKTIGVALRAAGMPGGFWDIDDVRLFETSSGSMHIDNPSFETPVVDPNGFSALPFVEGWTEIDLDSEMSTNTGVFANPAEGSPGRLLNADGNQLAFLGSETGNALEQELTETYRGDRDYLLTVGVGVSGMFPPSAVEPVDALELVLYCRAGDHVYDVASKTIEASDLSSTQLKDFSLFLSPSNPGHFIDSGSALTIGIAVRAAGNAGGFWDIDNVRLFESVPKSVPIENASFESPIVDPNGFSALPFVDGWTETDLDVEASTNTGVFANPPVHDPARLEGARGKQLAFLSSQTGNALEQNLAATYKVDCEYSLYVRVGVSGMFPPSMTEPVDKLELVLYYLDGTNAADIAAQQVEATGLSSTALEFFSLHLPLVQAGDAWAGKAIGVAIRAAGMPGGFWDIDDVRLVESPLGPSRR